jgi:plastocyanin
MSIRVRNRLVAILGSITLVLVLLSGTLLAVRPVESSDVVRFELIAESMTFVGGNPTLRVAAGDTVEILVVNADPGMLHDVVFPGLSLSTGALSEGDEIVLRFTVPLDASGQRFQYLCTYHPITMTGWLIVD